MLDKPIVIVDVETTGSSAAKSSITEIAAIKVADGKVIETFTSLVNPGRRIPHFITDLTGIDDAMVRDAPYFADIAPQLDALFKDSYFLAHNVAFDVSFVKKEMKEAGFGFPTKTLCSVKLSRSLYPNVRGHSLQAIIERFNLETDARHRALADTQAVLDFINVAVKELGEEAIQNAFAKQKATSSLPSNFDSAQLDSVGNTPGVYIFKDQKGVPIYIGKSKNLRTRIMSHFSSATSVAKELKISQKTHNLETIQTDSELEALLLESKMVKELLPVHNVKLRRKKEQTILLRNKNKDGYYTVSLAEQDLSSLTDPSSVFGVYENRRSAKASMQKLRDTFDLCPQLLGLEKGSSACFLYHLKKCKGACTSKEPKELYNLRMELAFQRSRIDAWKYPGPILLKVSPSKQLEVDQWIVTKEKTTQDDEADWTIIGNQSFDMDTYKILSSFIRLHPEAIIEKSFGKDLQD